MSVRYDIVVPTVGRPSLAALFAALRDSEGPPPETIVLVDDRPAGPPLETAALGWLADRTSVVPGPGRGPAAARNAGWRACSSPWVAFLDDDVVPEAGWFAALVRDLEVPADVAASQGRLHVPLRRDRRPTDWERNVAGLETARWATADMAYRRRVLLELCGFDERFQRAYREDADLALRALDRGYRLVWGERCIEHPVRPAAWHVSLDLQRGNCDDVLMDALHGPGWRARAGAPRGRRRRHIATSTAGVLALAASATGRARLARLAAGAWLAGTAELAGARLLPGPPTPVELGRMLVTSALMPPLASGWWLAGLVRHRGVRRSSDLQRPELAAVLVDRDGTLIADVPYNGDPARVEVLPGVRAGLRRLRAAGLRVAVISNQSGVGRGLITHDQMRAVNARVEELVGPLDGWFVCTHAPDAGCACRKPAPGLVLGAARALGVDAARCAVVGDIESDLEAAARAGARGVLVPAPATRPDEVARARERAKDFNHAVDLLLGSR